MKSSKEYSAKFRKFLRSFRKAVKSRKTAYEDPVDAIVFAIVSEHLSDADAETAIAKFSRYFINLNDLRVSRVEEIVDVLGKDTPQTRQMAATLIKVLRAVFDRHHSISLKGLKKLGKKPAKQALEKFNGITPFAVDYCLLTSLQAHAVPITGRMIEYFRSRDVIHPEADEQQIRGFVTKHVPAQQAFDFYQCAKAESEGQSLSTTSASSRTQDQTAEKRAGRMKTSRKKAPEKKTSN